MISFLKNKKEKTPKKTEKQTIENTISMDKKETNVAVYAMQILSIADVKKMIDYLDSGNIVLVSFNPLKKENAEKANEFLRRLIEYTRSIKANVLLIGNEYLAISPQKITINRITSNKKEKDIEKLESKKNLSSQPIYANK